MSNRIKNIRQERLAAITRQLQDIDCDLAGTANIDGDLVVKLADEIISTLTKIAEISRELCDAAGVSGVGLGF